MALRQIPVGEIPQLPYSWWSLSLLCSSTSLRGAEALSHGPDCCRTKEIHQVQFIDKVFDVPVVQVQEIRRVQAVRRSGAQVQQFPRVQAVRSPSRSHSCSSSYSCLDIVVACPLCATTYAWWFRVQKIAKVAQLQCSDTVIGVFLGPCTQVQARGRVHRATAAIIRCNYWRLSTNTFVQSSVCTTTTTTTKAQPGL